MNTLVLFYSYSGHTKTIAQDLAEKESCEIAEIKDVRRPGKLKAYTAGIIASIRGKEWAIQPLSIDLDAYDRVILLAPIWAGNPPPAFNAALSQLSAGKTVALKMVSGSGKSGCKERLETAITAKGSTLESFDDIKAQ